VTTRQEDRSPRIEIFAKGKLRTTPEVPSKIVNPSSTKKIPLEEAVVFDFMPPIVGDQYRTDPILNKQLFRKTPVSGPFIAMNQAYTSLAESELEKGNITAALEAHKFARDSNRMFTTFIGRMQDKFLLSSDEMSNLNTDYSDLDIALARKLESSGAKIDHKVYSQWLDETRGSYAEWHRLNQTKFGSYDYIKACLEVGRVEEARHLTEDLGRLQRTLMNMSHNHMSPEDAKKEVESKEMQDLTRHIRTISTPIEILDTTFLRSWIEGYQNSIEFGF
jgi:hypothetical protein